MSLGVCGLTSCIHRHRSRTENFDLKAISPSKCSSELIQNLRSQRPSLAPSAFSTCIGSTGSANSPPLLAFKPSSQPFISRPFSLLSDHPTRYSPSPSPGQYFVSPCVPNQPPNSCGQQRAGKLAEGELGRQQIGHTLVTQKDTRWRLCLVRRRGRGGRNAILVDMGNGSVILGQKCEDERRRPCGEIIEVVECEWTEGESEEERW